MDVMDAVESGGRRHVARLHCSLCICIREYGQSFGFLASMVVETTINRHQPLDSCVHQGLQDQTVSAKQCSSEWLLTKEDIISGLSSRSHSGRSVTSQRTFRGNYINYSCNRIAMDNGSSRGAHLLDKKVHLVSSHLACAQGCRVPEPYKSFYGTP